MRFTFLGTSGYHPSAARHTTGLAVPELGVLFDAGSGSFRVPEVFAAEPNAEQPLDIYLTHAHLDHIVGLTFFIVWLEQKRFVNVRVFARQEVHDAVDEHLFSDLIFPVRINYERCLIDAEQTHQLRDGSTLRTRAQPHRGITLGYRIDTPGGESLAFCTDTTAYPDDPEAIEFANGVDVLIHECHFDDAEERFDELTGHSSLSKVCQLAKSAGVKRLVLTHINPYYDEQNPLNLDAARAAFPGLEVAIAEDLMTIDV